MKTANRSARNGRHHKRPPGQRAVSLGKIAEIADKFKHRVTIGVCHNAYDYGERHDDQNDAEHRINLADDLVYRHKRADKIINEDYYHPNPRLYAPVRQRFKQRGRRDYKHCGHEYQQHYGKKPHDDLHNLAEITPRQLNYRRAVVTRRDHARKIVVYRTAEDATYHYPQKHDRSEQRPAYRAEYRTRPGDIQKFYQKRFPLRERSYVNAVGVCDSGRQAIVDRKHLLRHPTVNQISADKQHKRNKKSNHLFAFNVSA